MAILGGSQNLTADGDVGVSGKAKHITAIHIVSTGTAAIVSFYNGTAATGTAYLKLTGTASTGSTVTFPEGILFASGCFIDLDANTTSVLVGYRELVA